MITPRPGSTPLAQAVVNRDLALVEKLLAVGAPPDSADERGQSALTLATATDQYRMANLLVAHGANIWFADRLGFTPAIFAQYSRLRPDSEEGRALRQFISLLQKAGYPWPPATPPEVKALREAGRWPPVR
ncbi:hypothetical protein DK26_11815 [Bosea sp. WAO]|uniref:ankyrin repeat domain-containing protein n=1 Tax=Bosea sp. WAO TaxID=406341 RepID=UPI0007497268|nr:ankyrin repeat domain-containing protein [Bosea sp. WAO]KUL95743.1 hypothetical protein DK26_11815 [Bosea sp. WAO]